jgi:hypothetical protein
LVAINLIVQHINDILNTNHTMSKSNTNSNDLTYREHVLTNNDDLISQTSISQCASSSSILINVNNNSVDVGTDNTIEDRKQSHHLSADLTSFNESVGNLSVSPSNSNIDLNLVIPNSSKNSNSKFTSPTSSSTSSPNKQRGDRRPH